MSSAARARWRSTLRLVAQPTTRLEYRSRITARYSQPCSVHKKVMSVTQDSLGRTAVKLRSSRFGAIGKLCFESVVVRKRRRQRATSLLSRISLATRLRLTRAPEAFRSA